MKKESRIEHSLFAKFAKEITNMYENDQNMRTRAIENKGVIENEEDKSLDLRNTERMKEIVKVMGWPTISKVGEKISNMAWLLIQHADHDVGFQKQCLEFMEQSFGDVSKRNIGYLEDRIRVNEGRPQLYGTQFRGEGENYGPAPIENPEKVDERRKGLGMESLEEYARLLKEKYKVL